MRYSDTQSAFTPEQIAEANKRHDEKYGWTIEFHNVYTRWSRDRFPEMFYGSFPEEAHKYTERWKASQKFQEL